MTLPRWLIDFGYRIMDAGRSRKAAHAARQPPASGDFAALRHGRQALVVTFRRSGEPVPTPVNHGLDDEGRLYFRADAHSWKVRRMRSDPRVLVGPCNLRGRPLGPLTEGRARLLSPEEAARAYDWVEGNWSRLMRPLEKGLDRTAIPMVYVEVVPAESSFDARNRLATAPRVSST